MDKHRRIIVIGSIIVTAAIMLSIIAAVLLNNSEQAAKLVLVNEDTGEIYAQWDCYDGLQFEVEFIHSVNKSPVCDVFEITDNVIYVTATRYSDFGAGVQTELGEGQTLSYENGEMIVSGFNQPFEKVRYIVGTVSDHILRIEGENISLRELCGRNARVYFALQ